MAEKATLVALEQLKVELQGKVDLTTSERDALQARLLAAEEAKRIAEDKVPLLHRVGVSGC